MSQNVPELLNPDNCVLALIDYQPQMLFGVNTIDRQLLMNNVVGLAKAAKIFDVPTILTTVETKAFSGNTWPALLAALGNPEPIERTTMNSWEDENFKAAVEVTGRKKLVLGGLWTEVCVTLAALDAARDGYEVYVPVDAIGGTSADAHNMGIERHDAAGHHPGDLAAIPPRAAARLGAARHLRRGDGPRQAPQRRLRLRRRVRLHDGPRRRAQRGLTGSQRGDAMTLQPADLLLTNGRITTLDPARPSATAAAVRDGRFVAVGDAADVEPHRGDATRVVDLRGRRVIPGLNDSHIHVIRGGLMYNLELRWDGVESLALALDMLREQAKNTPPPQWVRVIGGWSEFQFEERRMPTLEELNEAAPDTPVFVLHLYARALLNRAALRALGIDGSTPNPPGGLIQRDSSGEPTGLFIAEPNAFILYSTIARAPRLSPEDQMNSSRHYMRELNRLGLTSASDAGGGGQNFPDDYEVIRELHRRGELTLRIAYNLFAQKPARNSPTTRVGWA